MHNGERRVGEALPAARVVEAVDDGEREVLKRGARARDEAQQRRVDHRELDERERAQAREACSVEQPRGGVVQREEAIGAEGDLEAIEPRQAA
jgi:hypothetical protein